MPQPPPLASLTPLPPVEIFRGSQQRAEASRQRQLENYQILRTLALRGELEAFSAVYALDFERSPEAFDETVACWGKVWLERKGAL